MYYIDTCIWLNLFKKEGSSTKGIPYWKIAKDFLALNNKILVSTIVLKELSFTMKNFSYAQDFFKNSEFITIIKTTPNDYNLARCFEKEDKRKISFYDYLHVAIAKRHSVPLITRDKDLLHFAKKHIQAHKPEELLC